MAVAAAVDMAEKVALVLEREDLVALVAAAMRQQLIQLTMEVMVLQILVGVAEEQASQVAVMAVKEAMEAQV
jgi:hypothetical protein